MPRIQQYGPEVGGADPVGAISPNTEFAGLPGQALDKLGDVAIDFGQQKNRQDDLVQKSTANAELSAYAAAATEQLGQAVESGDQNEVARIGNSFSSFASDLQQKYDSDGVKTFITDQYSHLGAAISRSSITAHAEIAKQKTEDAVAQTFDAHSAMIMADPHSYSDVLSAAIASIHSHADAGDIPAAMVPKAERQMATQLAQSAVLGLARSDPKQAMAMLNSGAYDHAFDAKESLAAARMIEGYANAQDADGKREKRVADDARQAATDAWKDENANKLISGQLTAKSIMGSPLPAEEKIKWVSDIKRLSNDRAATRDSVFNSVAKRVYAEEGTPGKIEDKHEIVDYIGHGLSAKDARTLMDAVDKTDEGKALSAARRTQISSANAVLGKDALGMPDMNAGVNKARFNKDMLAAQAAAVKAGRPAISVWDGSDKTSPMFRLQDYKTSPQQMLQQQQQRTQNTIDADLPPDAKKAADANKRKPDESAPDFLKRRGM